MAAQKLRTIRLYGSLGIKFGRVHKFVVSNTSEAIRALCSQIEGFEAEFKNIRCAIRIGSSVVNESDIKKGALKNPVGKDDIRIAPVPHGSGRNGALQTVLGIILVVVGYFAFGTTTAAGVAMIAGGAGMAVGGVVMMLSPTPKLDGNRDSPENRASSNFNGPVNTSAQGNPVPVLYGELMVGSYVISGGIESEDLVR